MLRVMNRKFDLFRAGIFLLALLLCAGAGFKLFRSAMKVIYVSYADKYYKDNRMVQAEEFYIKAGEIKHFDYYDSLVAERRVELGSISQVKKMLSNMKECARLAAREKNVEMLAAVYEWYQSEKKKASDNGGVAMGIFNDAQRFYNIEKELAELFGAVRAQAEEQAGNSIKRNDFSDEAFKQDVLKIPAEYFGGEGSKTAFVSELFFKFDSSSTDYLFKSSQFSHIISEAQRIFKQNEQLGISNDWLIDKIGDYSGDMIKNDITKNDYDAFASHAKEFGQFAGNCMGGGRSAVTDMIGRKVQDDLNAAQKLISEKQYIKAIEIYNNIGKFRDTSAEIAFARKKWVLAEPASILNQKYVDLKFENIITGENTWGSMVYVLASSTQNKNTGIYLGMLLKDSSTSVAEAAAFTGGSSPARLSLNTKLDNAKPAIIVEGPSDKRNALYIIYNVENNKLTEILRIEADGIDAEKAGTLLVVNPVGEGAGETCIFTRIGGIYKFQKVKPAWTDIKASEASKYKNQLVRFRCEVVGFNKDGALARAVEDKDCFLLLTGGKLPEKGICYVTGRYAGDVDVKKGFNTIRASRIIITGK
ncbi:MAG: hypothetical protein ABFD25_08175 [Clostridiaceae bacterium]